MPDPAANMDIGTVGGVSQAWLFALAGSNAGVIMQHVVEQLHVQVQYR